MKIILQTKARLLGRLAELYAEDHADMPADYQKSYDLFQEAADAALEQGNGRMATKVLIPKHESGRETKKEREN